MVVPMYKSQEAFEHINILKAQVIFTVISKAQ